MTLELETERLILRPLAPGDATAHIAMMEDPDIARFLTVKGKPDNRMIAWRAFASMLGHWQIRGFGFFSVFEKSSGVWVGRVGPWMPEGWPSLECGWSISRQAWGKGYAPEAAIAAINWIFREKPDLPRIISLIDTSNANSQAVARKIGETNTRESFQFESISVEIWGAEREEWLSKVGAA